MFAFVVEDFFVEFFYLSGESISDPQQISPILWHLQSIYQYYNQRKTRSLPFIDFSGPSLNLVNRDWKSSLKISSVLLLIMIFILLFFECINCLSSLSFDDIKLMNFHYQMNFLLTWVVYHITQISNLLKILFDW